MTEESQIQKEPWEMTKTEIHTITPLRHSYTGIGEMYDLQGNLNEWGKLQKYIEDVPKEDVIKALNEHIDNPYGYLVVRKAISEGRFVPPEVLAEYPNLSVKLLSANNKREAWQMTQREIIDQARKSKGWTTKTSAGWRSKEFTGVVSEHRATVKQALEEGKPVPEEVLQSYPDLLKPEVNVKPGDKVVVQGLKDTYEGIVTSVRDNSFWMNTPQFVKMRWAKGDIIEVIPGEKKEDIVENISKPNIVKRQDYAGAGYLE